MTQRASLLRAAAAALVTVVFLAPLATLLLGALHPPRTAPPSGLDVVPAEPSLGALWRAFDLVPLGSQLVNSILVVAVALPLSLVAASWAGFALTLQDPRTRRRWIGLALVLLVVPASAVWVPRFLALSQIGLVDSFLPLVLPAVMGTTPLAVLLFHWSYRRIPSDLLDAARLEGLGPLRLWWQVAAPWSLPTTVAAATVVFIAHWGNFVDALLYLYSDERLTLPLGLAQLRYLGPSEQSTILAGATVAAVPAVVAFAAVQRWFFSITREAGWLGE